MNPLDLLFVAVQVRSANYPRITLRRRTCLGIGRWCGWSDRYLAARFPELCAVWVAKAWGDKEEAAAFLSAVADRLLDQRIIGRHGKTFAVEMAEEHFVVISRKYNSTVDTLLEFAVEASRLFEGIGVPSLVGEEDHECRGSIPDEGFLPNG